MTSQEVISELDCLVPGNNQWEIASVGEGIYKVILQTKADIATTTTTTKP
jgi:hypothetical protein